MMALTFLRILFTVMLFCYVNGGKSDLVQSEYLNVPISEFVRSVSSTLDIVRHIISVVSQFSGASGDFRLSNAISDCLGLLDLTVDQLSRTISASQNPNGEENGTGNVSADMKTWLSAALANQETCKEGFDGTNTILENLIASSNDQVMSLICDLLSMVKTTPITAFEGSYSGAGGSGSEEGGGGHSGSRKLITNHQFPYWLKSHDRELLQTANGSTADVVVAADGSGNFTSIQDAINAAPELNRKRFVIYVKKGVYKEYVEIMKKKWNIMLVGDGMDVTVISGNRSYCDGWNTFSSATFGVKGLGFIGRDITFENTAGPQKHQAVAFRSDSDLSVLYRCAMRGYQDTLYAHGSRQFYRECNITGTVDFIFGSGIAVFQNCQILARKGLPSQKNTITANGRNRTNQSNSGFSIQFSNISVDQDVLGSLNSTPTYLGRPWGLYSLTVIMQSYISDAIRPEGWLEFRKNKGLDTLYYGEYKNYGPGAGLSGRVKWAGYHVINDSAEASRFTVAEFIMGNAWLPSTGVTYRDGLAIV